MLLCSTLTVSPGGFLGRCKGRFKVAFRAVFELAFKMSAFSVLNVRAQVMRSGLWVLAVFFSLVFTAEGLAGDSQAAGVPCPPPQAVVVAGGDEASRIGICRAAAEAIAFLACLDLLQRRAIFIELVEQPIDNHGFVAFGRYEPGTDRIELISYRSLQAGNPRPEIFGEPLDVDDYAGLVAHEVAHAVIEPNLRRKQFSAAPQEYLAYATQLAVLPPARRARIIAAMGVGPWEAGDHISNIYMAMNPGKFAVKSYLHLVSMVQPKAFVRLLIDARWFDIQVPAEAPRHRP